MQASLLQWRDTGLQCQAWALRQQEQVHLECQLAMVLLLPWELSVVECKWIKVVQPSDFQDHLECQLVMVLVLPWELPVLGCKWNKVVHPSDFQGMALQQITL